MNFLRQITEGKYIYTFIFFNGTLKFQYIRVLRRRLLLRHVKTDNLTRTQLIDFEASSGFAQSRQNWNRVSLAKLDHSYGLLGQCRLISGLRQISRKVVRIGTEWPISISILYLASA